MLGDERRPVTADDQEAASISLTILILLIMGVFAGGVMVGAGCT